MDRGRRRQRFGLLHIASVNLAAISGLGGMAHIASPVEV